MFNSESLTTDERVGWWCKMVWYTHTHTDRHTNYQIHCGNGKLEAIKNTNKDKIEILSDLFSQGGSSLSYKCNLLNILNIAHIKQMRVDRAASKNRLSFEALLRARNKAATNIQREVWILKTWYLGTQWLSIIYDVCCDHKDHEHWVHSAAHFKAPRYLRRRRCAVWKVGVSTYFSPQC